MLTSKNSSTASSTAFRYVDINASIIPSSTDHIQPDGYLTEERKAADDDHGFSTFFSETGELAPSPLLPEHIRLTV